VPVSPSQTALDAALRFLAVRPRSEAETRRRLLRAGFVAEQVEATLALLREHALVDDASFARYWVEQRQTFRPRGRRLLQAELAQRGVSRELAAEAAGQQAETADDDAYRAAYKRAQQLRGLDQRQFQSRLGAFLARRGFDWDVVAPTVSRLWQELSTSSGSAPAPTA
jgi:regulatory protein